MERPDPNIFIFLLIKNTTKANLYGIGFVVFFIVFHYIVAAYVIHNTTSVYVPLGIAEVIAALALIIYWHRKTESPPLD